jgi:hypothetical protein
MTRVIAAMLILVVGSTTLPAFGQISRSSEPLEFESLLAEGTDLENEEEEEEEIETDRDSFTPATTTSGYRRLIIEAAHSLIDNRAVPDTHSFPELLMRYGANDWLELRLGWNYEVGGAGNPISGNVPSDFDAEAELERASRVLYGLKAGLTNQDVWLPQSAVILQGFTPTSGESSHTDISASYVFGWTLPNRWVWDSAVRYSTGLLEGDDFNIWTPSTVLKIPVNERWKAHIEYFGVLTNGREDESVQHFFSTGARYLLTSSLEIGGRVGWGLNRDAPNFFSNFGIGWRY